MEDAAKSVAQCPTDAGLQVLCAAIEVGASAGLDEDRLAAAREGLLQAQRAAAQVVLQSSHKALDSGAPGVSFKVELLRRAIEQAVAANLSEDQLAAAQAAMREASRQVALSARGRAHEALDLAIRGTGQGTAAGIEALRSAINQGRERWSRRGSA